jgi:CHU_C Type IX secretion signal domain
MHTSLFPMPLKPTTRGIRIISKFIIYNRYGQKVFEAKDFVPNTGSIGWNGKLNGEDQTPQTYVYYLSAICDSGETLEKKESFILVR